MAAAQAHRARSLDADGFEQLVLQARAGRPIRLSDIAGMTFGTDDAAREEGRLTYNTARSIGLSAASWVTDPATGKCELCDGGWSSGQRCQPSPRGTYVLHFSVFAQRNAYAYMLERCGPDRAQWPHDPLAKRARPGQAEPAAAASPPAGRRFGAQPAVEPDPPPADPSLFGGPKPAATRKTGTTTPQESGSAKAPGNGLPDRIRRFLG